MDKKSGLKGIILSISEIKWFDSKNVEVSGGYYEGGLSSSGNIYKLQLKNGQWVVVEDKMLWISRTPPNKLLNPTLESAVARRGMLLGGAG